MLSNDLLANVLHIDLTRKRWHTEQRADLFERYLGGAGVASQLLLEECPPGIDPYDPANPIIFAVGPLTGMFPLASKTVAMFKSPLTGNLGESHAGGRSAIAIRMAGYGAIVIKGVSATPVYISIDGSEVHFRDARTLWGMHNAMTVGRVIRENEKSAGLRTIMRIGGAGEALVSYAAVTTETYRHFGRLGLGAVFGSKHLKAVVVAGRHRIPVSNRSEYRKLYDEVFQACVTSPVMKKYRDLGTPENVLPLNTLGGLPTRNLQTARLPEAEAEAISGECFAENNLGRRIACAHCPVSCIHIATLREPYEDEPYFYKTTMVGYDYELIYALGTMLGIVDRENILRLIDVVESEAIDAMSTGVVLAWATEAQERGLIGTAETDGLKLSWGDRAVYAQAVKRIVSQPNDFYRALARGVEFAAAKYGGREFALAHGKNEMPGYHTGPAAQLGFAIGARHSHLDNAGYTLDQKVLINHSLSPEEIGQELIKEEIWRQVLSSIVICYFARGIYTPATVQRALACAGYTVTPEQLTAVGEQIYLAKYSFKLREGFRFEDLQFPKRLFETPSPTVPLVEPEMQRTISYVRDWVQTRLAGKQE